MDEGEEVEIRCPDCGLLVSSHDEVCPNCGFDIKGWLDEKTLDEILSKMDDETFEIRGEDQDSIAEKIKRFAPKDVMTSEREVDAGGKMVYECPICGTEVGEDEDKCPVCGALFQD